MNGKAATIVLLVLGILSVTLSSPAAEPVPASKLQVTCKRLVGDRLKYHVVTHVTGRITTPGASEPTPIDLTYEMTARYSVIAPSTEGTTDVMINAQSANLLVDGQKIPAPALPQSVVTLDASGKISSISRMGEMQGVSGANLSGLIALLLPVFPNEEMAAGQTWSSESNLRSPRRRLTIGYSFLGGERVGEVDTALVKQTIGLVSVEDKPTQPAAAVRGTAKSSFSTTDGHLVKSQAEFNIAVRGPGGKDSSSVEAKATLDVITATD